MRLSREAARALRLAILLLCWPMTAEPAEPPLPELLNGNGDVGQRLFSPAALGKFFAALDRLEKRRARLPVRILQIGDSHSANDAFSGRMREALQARFGAAGRGWLPIGIPFKYFQPRLVTVEETGWRHLAGAEAAHAAPLGIDAGIAQSEQDGASMSLASTESEGFDRLAIEILSQPNGGTLTVGVDGHPSMRISTGGPHLRARRVEIPCPLQSRRAVLGIVGKQPVRLLAWTAERRRPGIIYENHGTIGATIGLFGQIDSATLAHELADSRPALIVVAFGTNEGFDDALDLRRYAAMFREHIETLRHGAQRASILVLGPPDGNRIDKAADSQDPCAWRPPLNLGLVRQAQRHIAAEQGWAFWDWAQAMGGECSMHRLFTRDPSWAFADHVHLNRLGYEATADVLFFDLMRAYEDWRRGHARSRAGLRGAGARGR
jgi:lysophospholipase L1-like esterase